ncbi:hypothetical protein BCR44DRAFT_1459522 [Catenaria anguillulae PL171]|uniref:Glycoside hydrolase family 5 C-terminal domain-containing protein n=1 Tax=Catenaria anguillulae PL171 TaxID=765915 RepID=A0A1Y2HT96_9FUNG|nr:hypothetical protein BCR44DRAFT_1459522 [Catenaria anguillulae PL171]
MIPNRRGNRHKRSKSASCAPSAGSQSASNAPRDPHSFVSPTKTGTAAPSASNSPSGTSQSVSTATSSARARARRQRNATFESIPYRKASLSAATLAPSSSSPVPDISISSDADAVVQIDANPQRKQPSPPVTGPPIPRDKHRRTASFSSVAIANRSSPARSRQQTNSITIDGVTLSKDSLTLTGDKAPSAASSNHPPLSASGVIHHHRLSIDSIASESHKDGPESYVYYPTSKPPASDWFAGGKLVLDGPTIRDAFGRTVMLRGVNLCGNSKLPTTPHADNPEHSEFFDTKSVSFVGRPFPLEEADEHFSRLAHWGLTFVRLLVPWEALEHAGPGKYDEEYITYLIKLCELMPKYGIRCFIDPHQDVWSRFSGGSGAPGWTFEVVGMDIRKFKATGAAHVHNAHLAGYCDCTVDPVTGVFKPRQTTGAKGDAQEEAKQRGPHGELPYQPMLWPSNYTKLASATMFTLFFAGATFAPNRMVDGENIQHYLQRHYLNCYKYLASRVKHLDAVIGFEVMNEPHQGYIGLHDMTRFDPTEALLLGDNPSALQSFLLGEGIEQDVEVWVRSWPVPSRYDSTRVVNAERERVWLPGYSCPWLAEGVYALDPESQTGGVLLKPRHFSHHPRTGVKIDFNQDFYLPFIQMYANAVHAEFPAAMIMAEPIPQELPPVFNTQIRNLVYAPHWYDVKSLFSKSFNGLITHDVPALRLSRNILAATYFGLSGAKRNYTRQLGRLKGIGEERVGSVPTIIGECGIPMDLNKRSAFDSGNYTHHKTFSMPSFRHWKQTYCTLPCGHTIPYAALSHILFGNDNTHGDYWNGEDFSIYSPRQHVQYQLKPEERRARRKSKLLKASLGVPIPSSTTTKLSAASTSKSRIAKRTAGAKKPAKLHLGGGSSSSNSLDNKDDDHERRPLLAHNDNKYDAMSSTASLDTSLTSPSSYGRQGAGFRHSPVCCAGRGYADKVEFDVKTLKFRLEFTAHQVKLANDRLTAAYFKYLTSEIPAQCYESVIYVPKYHYGYESLVVTVSDGHWAYFKGEQTLVWRIDEIAPGSTHWLQMEVKSRMDGKRGANSRRCCGNVQAWVRDTCSVM